jgi:hypothetical protein
MYRFVWFYGNDTGYIPFGPASHTDAGRQRKEGSSRGSWGCVKSPFSPDDTKKYLLFYSSGCSGELLFTQPRAVPFFGQMACGAFVRPCFQILFDFCKDKHSALCKPEGFVHYSGDWGSCPWLTGHFTSPNI